MTTKKIASRYGIERIVFGRKSGGGRPTNDLLRQMLLDYTCNAIPEDEWVEGIRDDLLDPMCTTPKILADIKREAFKREAAA